MSEVDLYEEFLRWFFHSSCGYSMKCEYYHKMFDKYGISVRHSPFSNDAKELLKYLEINKMPDDLQLLFNRYLLEKASE